jgi:hypothetical protein
MVGFSVFAGDAPHKPPSQVGHSGRRLLRPGIRLGRGGAWPLGRAFAPQAFRPRRFPPLPKNFVDYILSPTPDLMRP